MPPAMRSLFIEGWGWRDGYVLNASCETARPVGAVDTGTPGGVGGAGPRGGAG